MSESKPSWGHRHLGFTITLANTPENHAFAKMIEDRQRCYEHRMEYAVLMQTYRKYKRGKNRCKGCGIKLNQMYFSKFCDPMDFSG